MASFRSVLPPGWLLRSTSSATPLHELTRASPRRRILFVSESVTLAHVGRPSALLAGLDGARYDGWIACDPRSRRFLTVEPERFVPISSLDSRRFAERLRWGRPVYEVAELRDYVRADLALIERVEPDLVVGDFRLSLSVSARLARVPYACISNAYWSPYAQDQSLPLPVLPWTRFVPLSLAQRAFHLVQALALAGHCRALNAVRAEHGLDSLGSDLRVLYTDADHTLYADSPDHFPLADAPAHHWRLGTVPWSPPGGQPPWWDDLPGDQPVIYLTMGSSGSQRVLVQVIDSLADLGVSVIVSTAGAALPVGRWRNVWLAEYLPGQAAAARSALVVCNGGSPTSQQALAAGVPVVGICDNMDQMLNMRGLVAAGLGTSLRADRLTPRKIRAAVEHGLGMTSGGSAGRHNPIPELPLATRFQRFLDAIGIR